MDSAVRLVASETHAGDITPLMAAIGRRARAAQRAVMLAPAAQRSEALNRAAEALRGAADAILAANRDDVAEAAAKGQPASFVDRLTLTPARLEGIAKAVEDIAALPDPVGRVLASFTRPNGLVIERVATPLGVIAVIFESRPNVTADAGALCIKSGNAAILRAGSESLRTSQAIADAMRAGLARGGLTVDALQLVPVRDRAAVGASSRGCRARRGCRCSRISTATAMCMSTPLLIPRWRRPCCSTPRCGARACAAPPRRCWWTGRPLRSCSPWCGCCSTPAAPCAAMPRRKPSMPR
jgi:glutamate-5-semialdehyde dehydrogenase